MNTEILQGKWLQAKGLIQEKWGEITGDELDQINGNKELLIGKMQEKYGISKEKAQEAAEEIENKIQNI